MMSSWSPSLRTGVAALFFQDTSPSLP